MEEELLCPVCSNVVKQPVILPCSHRICRQCFQGIISHTMAHAGIGNASNTDNDTHEIEHRAPMRPKLSDNESGYSTSSNDSTNSRMQFYGGVNEVSEKGQRYELGTSPLRIPEQDPSFPCPVCKRFIFLGDPSSVGRGVRRNSSSSRPQSLEIPSSVEVVDAFQRLNLQGVDIQYCEMCEVGASVAAVVKCEQCQVRYCEECLHRYHPPRGPLASHILLKIRLRQNSGRLRVRKISGSHPSTPTVHELPPGAFPDDYETIDNKQQGVRLSTCAFHVVENMTLFCEQCCVPLCKLCVDDGRHNGHNIKPIGSVYESYKADLSRVMNGLSSKARLVTKLIVQLRGMENEIQGNCSAIEAQAVAQCNSLIEAIEQKKREIPQLLKSEKERKYKIVRDQLQSSTMKLKRTTGLLEYCIEIMKGNDAAVFLQVSPGLIQRVSATEQQWGEEQLTAKASGGMDIDLDCRAVLKAIEEFNITRRGAPEKPIIKISECSAVNNTVTLSWAAPSLSRIDAYILEIDDGSKGPFRDVYHGKQTACTIDGLHFDSVYRARVSAYNNLGRSLCSDIVQLQTSEVAIFRMDPNLSHPDIRLSHDCCTINCKSTDQKIGLSNTCFSKGIHYWEYSIDNYESSDPDIAVGIATSKVNTNFILGKDVHAWSMYVDSNRTWFLHNNVHTSRIESGVQVGSRLGVLLNLQNQSVTYFVNQKQQGQPVSIAIGDTTKKPGSVKSRLFYPAVSINKKVQLTLWSGLRPAFHGRTSGSGDSNIPCPESTVPGQKNTDNHEQFLMADSVDKVGRRTQSSFDLKNQQSSGERLYHSLPPKLVVNKTSLEPMSHTLDKRHSTIDNRPVMSGIAASQAAKPPIPWKPRIYAREDSISARIEPERAAHFRGETPRITVSQENNR